MTRTRSLLALLLLSALSACGSDGPLSPGSRRALDTARDKWRARNVRSYEFVTHADCFCPAELTRPARVVVRNDTVQSVTMLDGTPVPAVYMTYRPTVNALFDLAANDPGAHIARVEVEFDTTYGYPTRVALVARQGIADGDLTWYASGLRPLP